MKHGFAAALYLFDKGKIFHHTNIAENWEPHGSRALIHRQVRTLCGFVPVRAEIWPFITTPLDHRGSEKWVPKVRARPKRCAKFGPIWVASRGKKPGERGLFWKTASGRIVSAPR